jgi:DNA-binding transcriptional MocR family regulator
MNSRNGADYSRRLPLYRRVAGVLEAQIRQGTFRFGERIPSIRASRSLHRVSRTTVLQAYFWLESRGYIESRPQSGFYVRIPFSQLVPEPEFRPVTSIPRVVGLKDTISEILRRVDGPPMAPLGTAVPSHRLLPNKKLNQFIRAVIREVPHHSSRCEPAAGSESLRRQVARRSLAFGCNFSVRDIVITCGAMEALNLSLRAVTTPGGLVAIESPICYTILQAIESLGLRALEVPTHPRTGIDLDLLERAIKKYKIQACLIMTNCHNPLGFIMPDNRKRELVEVTAKHNVPIIEDDVFGELSYQFPRPRTAKAYDRKGLVLLCSSYSKFLGAGFRVGWVHAGRYARDVEQLKSLSTLATPNLPQLTIAKFLETTAYDRYLRHLSAVFAQQVQRFSLAIQNYFPEETRVSRPEGGFLLWVQLPAQANSTKLYRRAASENISILPGTIFSPSRRFDRHIRINCGNPWSEALDHSLRTLGKICKEIC